MKNFIIKESQTSERLDKFLAENFPDFTRSQIQKLIKQGNIIVDGEKVLSHYNLKEGDNIKIVKTDFSAASILPAEETSQQPVKLDIKIIAKNDDYLVVNKPAGLTMHGGGSVKEKTLADFLVEKYPGIKKVGEEKNRPGIVHRLDKEASGLVAIARSQRFFLNLKDQFKRRKTEKEYTVLVYGRVDKEGDIILFPIKRAQGGFKMAAMPVTDREKENSEKLGVREAITEFKIAKRFINFTLLKVKIKTGRTHQIRVHMFAYGHPVVGDGLYNTKKTREQNKKLKLGRIFLVADKLSFYDKDGEKQTFKINLPKELKEFLERVK
jgi:23S rRNA pseudouridine1911/1915/1917 synthase